MSATNEAFATAVADELSRCGIKHVCIAPGSRSGPLALAFEREPGLDTHVHIDERSAGFFALGIARASRRPAVVVCTSGSAAANLFPAIVEARQALVPMVVMTADRPPELRATGANQTIDQLKMFGDSVVWFADSGIPDEAPGSAGYWRSLTCRAVTESIARSGPVHLNVPLREPLYPEGSSDSYPHPIEGRAGGRPWTEVVSAPAACDETAAELARMIDGAERGVVVAGATTGELSPMLALAEAAGWPVLAEPSSNIRVPGTISSYDALLRVGSFVDAHRPEVVLRTGKLALGRPLARFLSQARQVAIGAPGTWWDEQRKIATMVAADPGTLCGRVTNDLVPRTRTSWLASWRHHDDIARAAIDAALGSTDNPSEPRTARDLAAALPDGTNLFSASSMPVRELDSFMVPRTGLRIHANRGANGIDGNVSTAMGIAAASGARTAALVGDLALLHDSNAMLHDRSSELDLAVVVLNNDGGGIFSFLEQARVPDFERIFGTPHGIDLQRWAHLYDIPSEIVTSAAALPEVVLGGRGTRLIEVRTDRDDNLALHHAVWESVEDAISSAA